METITEHISLQSEYGDPVYPCILAVKMDGSKPDCPVTFWMGETAVFSMGSDEIDEFCKQLKRMDCSPI